MRGIRHMLYQMIGRLHGPHGAKKQESAEPPLIHDESILCSIRNGTILTL